MFGGRMGSVRFAVTHFGHSQIFADTSSHQLRSNRTQACWRDDGFDLFHLSTLARNLGPTLTTCWRVFSENCGSPPRSVPGFCLRHPNGATGSEVVVSKASVIHVYLRQAVVRDISNFKREEANTIRVLHLAALLAMFLATRHALRLVLDNISGAQHQAEWFASSEKSMHTTKIAKPAPNLPIDRIRNTRDLFALVPREIHHLLLVVDPSDESETALTVALEIAERWGPQITLVCGARLSGWVASEESPADTALIDLLCRSWQVRRAYPDVSISRSLPTSVAEVLQEAVDRKADLIMVPELLAARFRHLELMMAGGRLRASCPIVIVAEPEDDWLLGHR